MGLWSTVKHWAPVPQSQGSLHCLLIQASPLGQSSSLAQPGGLGSSTGLHLVSVSGTHPSLQLQIMVLKGRLLTTVHTEVT